MRDPVATVRRRYFSCWRCGNAAVLSEPTRTYACARLLFPAEMLRTRPRKSRDSLGHKNRNEAALCHVQISNCCIAVELIGPESLLGQRPTALRPPPSPSRPSWNRAFMSSRLGNSSSSGLDSTVPGSGLTSRLITPDPGIASESFADEQVRRELLS
jgi:hypothetical protein